jgi:hypothetical protein
VQYAICMFVCLNILAIFVVSLPTYVRVHHFLCGLCGDVVSIGCSLDLGFCRGLWVWFCIRNWLLCKMF